MVMGYYIHLKKKKVMPPGHFQEELGAKGVTTTHLLIQVNGHKYTTGQR